MNNSLQPYEVLKESRVSIIILGGGSKNFVPKNKVVAIRHLLI
jgi:hypothetical protein